MGVGLQIPCCTKAAEASADTEREVIKKLGNLINK
ncbi:hypothetical protein AVE30378_04897 [Achromobacter veterisilvae]|uniref:Uncharacterized protein n=1 Tax=Achromobacter veterisilvae TaxID=2069367 RepID=A0A446CW40_9BURK|nr:hypothetical protein AVE30378_04897 [Achromobacter veterisilvae]